MGRSTTGLVRGRPASGEERDPCRWPRCAEPLNVRELLAACFVLFTGLVVWPLLSIPDRPVLIGGVPALVLHLFGVWALVVAVLAWASRHLGGDDGP